MGRLSTIGMRPLTAAERRQRLMAAIGRPQIAKKPLTAAERQRRLRARFKATAAWGPLLASAAPILNERDDASGFLDMSGDGVVHQDSEHPTWDNEDSHEPAELIRIKGDGPAEPTLLFGHSGTVGEDMEAIFGRGRLNTSRDRLPMSTAVRHISLNADSPIDWLRRMRDLRVCLPTSFRAFPRFHRRSESGRSYSELIQLPTRTAVRHISLNANLLLDWLRRMRDFALRVRLPTSFRAFPQFGRRPESARSYSELIAQREMPKSARSSTLATPLGRAGRTVALGALGITMFAIVFLAGLYVTLDPASTAEQPLALVVTASRLNCRVGPSLQSKVLYVAKRDEKLDVLGQGVRWWRVRVQHSQCWVSTEYVKSIDAGRQQRMRGWLAGAQAGLRGLESSRAEREQSK